LENIFRKFLELMTSFEKNDVEYILIGGLAINLHGFARNTQDIDLFVNPNKENISKLQNSLFEVFSDKDVFQITSDELEEYPVIRFVSESGIVIDIISGLGKEFSISDLDYEIKEIDGIKVRCATLQTLYKLKEKTYREIDQLDLKFIKNKLDNNAD
jgi:predicted nucleotidyltransferase